MNIIETYKTALQAIYDHVGFTEDWVVYPIQDHTDQVWSIQGDEVKYADSIEQYNSDGDYYLDEIYTQRFYSKHIYEGKEYTMIFCDPHVDGAKWLRVFNNSKKVK